MFSAHAQRQFYLVGALCQSVTMMIRGRRRRDRDRARGGALFAAGWSGLHCLSVRQIVLWSVHLFKLPDCSQVRVPEKETPIFAFRSLMIE